MVSFIFLSLAKKKTRIFKEAQIEPDCLSKEAQASLNSLSSLAASLRLRNPSQESFLAALIDMKRESQSVLQSCQTLDQTLQDVKSKIHRSLVTQSRYQRFSHPPIFFLSSLSLLSLSVLICSTLTLCFISSGGRLQHRKKNKRKTKEKQKEKERKCCICFHD